MPAVDLTTIAPSEDERVTLGHLSDVLPPWPAEARLISPRGDEIVIPHSLYDVLVRAARQLSQGRAVALVPAGRDLTTQEAADLLNVSRPFLIRLLEQGELPHTFAGSHRRVKLSDVLAYRDKRSARRSELLDVMLREAQEDEVFDLE